MRRLLHSLHRLIPAAVKRRVLEWWLSRSLPAGRKARLRVEQMPNVGSKLHRVRGRRDGVNFVIGLDLELIDRDSYALNGVWKRLPVMLRFFTQTAPEVREVSFDIGDGVDVADGALAFCSNNPTAVLVPDRTFMNGRSYRPFRKMPLAGPDNWASRIDTVLWRGGPNGIHGAVFNATMTPTDADLIQRVRLCLALRNFPGTDVKLTGVGRVPDRDEAVRVFTANELLGERIPAETWAGVKFAIDIDGYTNAWSNLFTRLLMGCCVLKVASPFGFKQWYYDDLRPWEHYVPVAADLSDLPERIAWCREHDLEASRIAAAGQAFALRRTPESETTAVVAQINARCGSPTA